MPYYETNQMYEKITTICLHEGSSFRCPAQIIVFIFHRIIKYDAPLPSTTRIVNRLAHTVVSGQALIQCCCESTSGGPRTICCDNELDVLLDSCNGIRGVSRKNCQVNETTLHEMKYLTHNNSV